MLFALITVSDSRSLNDLIKDDAADAVQNLIKSYYKTEAVIASRIIIADNEIAIEQELKGMIAKNMDIAITIGGTGVSPRDMTPEATRRVLEKELTGFSHLMIAESLKKTKFACLSRLICGTAKKTLIINLPGSTKASTECLAPILEIIPHAIDLIQDKKQQVQQVHHNLNIMFVSESNKSQVSKMENIADRSRQSTYPLREPEDAFQMIKTIAKNLKKQSVHVQLIEAVDRVAFSNLATKIEFPQFRTSTKDGYAVIHARIGSSRKNVFQVLGCNTPGQYNIQDIDLENECVRVSTGAPVPKNTTVVIPVEYSRLMQKNPTNNDESIIFIQIDEILESNIREIESDFKRGEELLRKNSKIIPTMIGLLAANDYHTVEVYRKPRVGVMSTGDELQDSFEKDSNPHKINDTNRIMLMSLLKHFNYDFVDLGIAKDSPDELMHSFNKGFEQCDVIVTTGGVSMGECDYVKAVLIEDFNAKIHFARLKIKPGKPTTFATCEFKGEEKSIFCLPGNPLSAFVTFHLFVIPYLKVFEGYLDYQLPSINVRVKSKLNGDQQRIEYHCVTLKPEGYEITAESMGVQCSSKLITSKHANGLLIVPVCAIIENDAFARAYIIDTI